MSLIGKDGTWYIREAYLRSTSSTSIGYERERAAEGHKSDVVWYAFDRFDLERANPPESDEERYARNERVMLAAAEEVLRLKPIVGQRVGEPVPVDEPETKEIAGVWARDLNDRDVEWHAWPYEARGGQHVNRQTAGVLALHRPTGVAVVATDHRSQMRNKDEAWRKLRRILLRQAGPAIGEPMPCSNCGGAESVCNCDCGGNYCGCACHLAAEQAAIGSTP